MKNILNVRHFHHQISSRLYDIIVFSLKMNPCAKIYYHWLMVTGWNSIKPGSLLCYPYRRNIFFNYKWYIYCGRPFLTNK